MPEESDKRSSIADIMIVIIFLIFLSSGTPVRADRSKPSEGKEIPEKRKGNPSPRAISQKEKCPGKNMELLPRRKPEPARPAQHQKDKTPSNQAGRVFKIILSRPEMPFKRTDRNNLTSILVKQQLSFVTTHDRSRPQKSSTDHNAADGIQSFVYWTLYTFQAWVKFQG